MRRNIFENIPQLVIIDQMLLRCREGQTTIVCISSNRNALEILKEQNIKNHFIQLEARIEVLTDIVQEFEGVYRILLGAQNRIHQ